MKVAVLSESAADERIIRILVDTILGLKTQPVAPPPLRKRGWPAVLNIVPAVVNHLHYRTDADAFVVVADSDESQVHNVAHEQTDEGITDCRLCLLRSAIRRVQSQLRPDVRSQPVKTAVGLACPCIEAWLCCGYPGVSEAAWIRERPTPPLGRHKRLDLKRQVYGSDRPTIQLAVRRGAERARRIAKKLDQLERQFPNGFGALARDVRAWLANDAQL